MEAAPAPLDKCGYLGLDLGPQVRNVSSQKLPRNHLVEQQNISKPPLNPRLAARARGDWDTVNLATLALRREGLADA